jgi:hypothetical protein
MLGSFIPYGATAITLYGDVLTHTTVGTTMALENVSCEGIEYPYLDM